MLSCKHNLIAGLSAVPQLHAGHNMHLVKEEPAVEGATLVAPWWVQQGPATSGALVEAVPAPRVGPGRPRGARSRAGAAMAGARLVRPQLMRLA